MAGIERHLGHGDRPDAEDGIFVHSKNADIPSGNERQDFSSRAVFETHRGRLREGEALRAQAQKALHFFEDTRFPLPCDVRGALTADQRTRSLDRARTSRDEDYSQGRCALPNCGGDAL